MKSIFSIETLIVAYTKIECQNLNVPLFQSDIQTDRGTWQNPMMPDTFYWDKEVNQSNFTCSHASTRVTIFQDGIPLKKGRKEYITPKLYAK